MKNTASPIFAPNSVFISSVKNFAIPPVKLFSSSTFTHARPAASASVLANSPISSKNFLPCFAPSGTIMYLIVLSLNALNSVYLKQCVASLIINGFLKSGLSIPYFSIASEYGILINGVFTTFQSLFFLNTSGITSSITLNTSSCVAKLISISN